MLVDHLLGSLISKTRSSHNLLPWGIKSLITAETIDRVCHTSYLISSRYHKLLLGFVMYIYQTKLLLSLVYKKYTQKTGEHHVNWDILRRPLGCVVSCSASLSLQVVLLEWCEERKIRGVGGIGSTLIKIICNKNVFLLLPYFFNP